jgi:hypothetical protein
LQLSPSDFVLTSQIPVLQLAVSQGSETEQVEQATPPLPHWLLLVPGWQVPCSRQPSQQPDPGVQASPQPSEAPHGLPSQAGVHPAQVLAMQWLVDAVQSAQGAPFLPHAVSSVPDAQKPEERQQPWQFVAPQAEPLSGKPVSGMAPASVNPMPLSLPGPVSRTTRCGGADPAQPAAVAASTAANSNPQRRVI